MFRHSFKIPLSKAVGACISSKAKSTPISLANRVVLITGATAGIGEACAWRFGELGSKLILVGRRDDRLKELKSNLQKSYPTIDIHTVSLSVSDTEAVSALPFRLPDKFKNVEVLVNNAGIALGATTVECNSPEDAKTVLDTNVLGVIAMCRAFLPDMKERGIGHVINMGSISGHESYTTGSIYCASKFAVEAFTSAARHDLVGTPVRVTLISPGMVGNTEFSKLRFKDDAKVTALYESIEALDPYDVADNVIYVATRPRHVQIADIVMYPTNQAGPRDLQRLGPTMGGRTLPPK